MNLKEHAFTAPTQFSGDGSRSEGGGRRWIESHYYTNERSTARNIPRQGGGPCLHPSLRPPNQRLQLELEQAVSADDERLKDDSLFSEQALHAHPTVERGRGLL